MESHCNTVLCMLFILLGVFGSAVSSGSLKEAADSVDKDALAKKFNAPKSSVSSLSPFGLLLLDKTASTGLFEKMYNVSFASPEDFAEQHYKAGSDFLIAYDVTDYKPTAEAFYNSALKAFKNGMTSFQFFHVVSDVIQSPFQKESNLDADEAKKLVDSFVQIFTEEVHRYKVDSAKSSLMAITATAKRFFKANGVNSPTEAKHIIEVYGSEFDKVGEDF